MIELSGWTGTLPPPESGVSPRPSQHCECFGEQSIRAGGSKSKGRSTTCCVRAGRVGCGRTARLRTLRTTRGGSCAKLSGAQTATILTAGLARSNSTCLFRIRNRIEQGQSRAASGGRLQSAGAHRRARCSCEHRHLPGPGDDATPAQGSQPVGVCKLKDHGVTLWLVWPEPQVHSCALGPSLRLAAELTG
jgi:hypothetical protein